MTITKKFLDNLACLYRLIEQYEQRLKREPGSRTEGCFIEIKSYYGNYTLFYESANEWIVLNPDVGDPKPLKECPISIRIDAAQHLPNLLKLAEEGNNELDEILEETINDLEQSLSSQETE